MRQIILYVVAAVLLAGGGYLAGRQSAHAPAGGTAPQAKLDERKPLYWHDPMVPQQKFDRPGKSPFMDMQLVPVYAEEEAAKGGVTVSSRAQQNLGVRTALAEAVEFREGIAAVGAVQSDERRMARAEVRAAGWVQKLHVRAVNDHVQAGQVLAELYSPELVAAQEEYLLALRMAKASTADEPLAEAGRRRLEALGLRDAQIRSIGESGAASRTVPILAPISGVVTELGVREGAMAQPGAPLFTITDLSAVWILVEVPESQAAALRVGLRATTRAQGLPGRTFDGQVDYLYPELNVQTRTVRARITVANPGLVLRPGMFVEVALQAGSRKVLAVPSEAVITTGTRNVVIVMDGERFRAATVKTGTERDGRTEILSGLAAGERVVASGQFLIDSEASLKGALDRLEAPGGTGKDGLHRGRGKVTSVDAAGGRVEVDHEAIPSLKWPTMTMEFVAKDKTALRSLRKGDVIEFDVHAKPRADGGFVIENISPRSAK